jgi:uncharacterized protein YecE (DUF72 family)
LSDSSPNIVVGTGGWAYLPVKHVNRLSMCAKLFDFAEVNSTFYKLPQEKLALNWRSSVPERFQFSVRANRRLTHESHLEPTEENFREYERNLSICRALNAFVLHFQFPPSFEVTNSVIENWRVFFTSLKKESGLNFAIEVRNQSTSRSALLKSFLENYDIIPTTDPTRGEIAVSRDSRILYSRVFGPGEHTKWSFSTAELENLKEKVSKTPAARRYVTFHNITMYEDGARLMRMLKREGNDVISPITGINSLKQAVLAERIEFPISGQELTSRLAWRTIDAGEGRWIHVNEVTQNLPKETRFESLGQVLDECQPYLESSSPGQNV